MLKTNEKSRKSQQRKRSFSKEIKRYKEPNGNFRSKKFNNQNIKTQWTGPITEWRGERRVNELEYRTIVAIKFEQLGESKLKKD